MFFRKHRWLWGKSYSLRLPSLNVVVRARGGVLWVDTRVFGQACGMAAIFRFVFGLYGILDYIYLVRKNETAAGHAGVIAGFRAPQGIGPACRRQGCMCDLSSVDANPLRRAV